MKSLTRIRYIFFALIILGFFANFAQNDYGWTISAYSELLISITFFINLFTDYKNVENKKWFLSANILGGYSFFAFFMEDTGRNHLFLHIASITVIIFFIGYGTWFLLQNKNEHRFWKILFTLFFLSAIFGFYAAGFTVKLPLKVISMHLAVGLFFLLTAIIIFRKKIQPGFKENIFIHKIRQVPDFIVIVTMFFIWWCSYWELRDMKILPEVYASSIPPAFLKLSEEGKKEQAETYWKNYNQFLENRKKDNN